jgi:hypothetical protein
MSNDANDLAGALREALGPRTSLVHPTYRHLGRPVTLIGLNRTQWVIVLLGLAGTWALTSLLPMPTQWALSVAGSLVGMPGALLFVLSADRELSLRSMLGGVRSWRRSAHVLLPDVAVATEPHGYELQTPATDLVNPGVSNATTPSVEDLWAS